MTDLVPIPDRWERYEQMRREGRLLRTAWTDHDRACWIAALSPEAGKARDAAACPAEVMPVWLAYLTPSVDDNVSSPAWPEMARRYGACARGWHRLDDAAWRRVEGAVRLTSLAVAHEAVSLDEWGVIPAIDDVVRLLREGGDPEEWAAAEAAAWAAAEAVGDAWASVWAAGGRR